MQWFLNLATRTKLFIGFGGMIVLLAVVVAMAYNGITEIEVSQKRLFEEEFASAVAIKDIRANQNGERESILMMLLTDDPAVRKAKEQDVRERSRDVDEELRTLQKGLKNEPQLLAQLEEFTVIRRSFCETRDRETIPLINAGKQAEAKRLALGIQAERNRQMRVIADKLVEATVKNAESGLKESEQRAARLVRLFLAVGSAAILFGITLAFLLNRIIATPLNRISEIAGQVAAGDLTVKLPAEKRRDEVGVLGETFRGMLENIGGMIREVYEGISVLASAASEIMASTAQVASGATETAAAVSETTCTVEEVKQTAQIASSKAQSVSAVAQNAVQVAQGGRKAVEESIAGMGRIQAQVTSIADSIVRLSEQSQAIGEIIATVNDLAEQSNLLAVNAAIEAAKAGEQGKGFTVVAQEVKSLAEQSKEATAQVRTILSDIQKATNAAVLATEQGSKAVETGVKQSQEAGEAIRQMGEIIEESAQAALQIAASSQQQLTGMDQVVVAMENIKQASEQNVTGMKQVELTVQNLHELGQKLKRLAEQYRV
jgi:methyl-accepting chemotaxis protein